MRAKTMSLDRRNGFAWPNADPFVIVLRKYIRLRVHRILTRGPVNSCAPIREQTNSKPARAADYSERVYRMPSNFGFFQQIQ